MHHTEQKKGYAPTPSEQMKKGRYPSALDQRRIKIVPHPMSFLPLPISFCFLNEDSKGAVANVDSAP